MVRGVRVGPVARLAPAGSADGGLRPRNAVVDITNYVMLECGHPLHAFDYALLCGTDPRDPPGGGAQDLHGPWTGRSINSLRTALSWCATRSGRSPIAGVMGGENSEISDATVDVVLESAYWDPLEHQADGKGARHLHVMRRRRFERGADPNGFGMPLIEPRSSCKNSRGERSSKG